MTTRTIARVTATEPPESVRTPQQWAEWRKGEDERMLGEIFGQIERHIANTVALHEFSTTDATKN